MAILAYEVEGIPVEVDEDVFNDFEFMEAIADLDASGNGFAYPRIARMLFGDSQLKNIKWQMKQEDGRVRADRMIHFIDATVEGAAKAKRAGDGKNS